MTDNEMKWAARVEAWQASGLTAPAFCQGKEFTPGGLRYWASRLRNAGQPAQAAEVRIARVVRTTAPVPELPSEAPVVIEIGAARLAVRRGFEPDVLRAVLAVLGASR